jgi:hypothetical protein
MGTNTLSGDSFEVALPDITDIFNFDKNAWTLLPKMD